MLEVVKSSVNMFHFVSVESSNTLEGEKYDPCGPWFSLSICLSSYYSYGDREFCLKTI